MHEAVQPQDSWKYAEQRAFCAEHHTTCASLSDHVLCQRVQRTPSSAMMCGGDDGGCTCDDNVVAAVAAASAGDCCSGVADRRRPFLLSLPIALAVSELSTW